MLLLSITTMSKNSPRKCFTEDEVFSMSTDNKGVQEVALELRKESEEVEKRIDKQLRAMARFNKRFTYLYNLKNNGVRIYEEVRKENNDFLDTLANTVRKIANIEKHDLAEGSSVYQKLKEEESLMNKELSNLMKSKEKNLEEELVRVGKEFNNARNTYLVELEEFKEISEKLQCAYSPKHKKNKKKKDSVKDKNSIEIKKEVLSAEEMLMRYMSSKDK